MSGNDSKISQFLLIVFFSSFYLTIEYFLLSRVHFPNFETLSVLVLILISFLNLVPAGIFAFALVSLLPRKLSSKYDEKSLLRRAPFSKKPKVALLYATYNDFILDDAEYDFAEACAGGYPFFILDDSTEPSKKYEVDSFASQYQCHLIRRKSRHGYKAGAINEWIRQFGGDFDYFFILDSDSRASHSSVEYCVELASRDQSLAVVQTKTLTFTSNQTRFTRSAVTIQHAYMEIVQKAMKNMGTSPYYGHNALIKIEALRSVGGFVEESNEDYKTLARLHGIGYRSIYAESALTWEEVPPDYLSAKKRALRWSRDAVSQLALLKYGSPISIVFFVVYGWITYMSNVALLGLIPIMSAFTFPQLFNNTFAVIAGLATLVVIIFWPILALRIRDIELTPRKMMSALLWGSVYNIPMMAPISWQIFKTSCKKILNGCKELLGKEHQLVEEFVVTPKIRETDHCFTAILSKMKAEVLAGVAIILISVASEHLWSLVFVAPQAISALSLPLLTLSGSKRTTTMVSDIERPRLVYSLVSANSDPIILREEGETSLRS